MRSDRRHLRHLLPLALLAALLWLMVGCIYIPWFEKPATNNAGKTDFRPLLVDGTHTDRPVRLGITRHQAIQALGPPRLATIDRRTFAYDFRTTDGYWVWPLCFAAEPGNERTYVAVLNFDDAGVLDRIVVTDKDYRPGPTLFATVPPHPEYEIIRSYKRTDAAVGFVFHLPAGEGWQILVPSNATTRQASTAPTTRLMPHFVPLEP